MDRQKIQCASFKFDSLTKQSSLYLFILNIKLFIFSVHSKYLIIKLLKSCKWYFFMNMVMRIVLGEGKCRTQGFQRRVRDEDFLRFPSVLLFCPINCVIKASV